MTPKSTRWITALALLAHGAAHAVALSPDGYGQALVFPYYTVRSTVDGAYNTYLSVTNADAAAKALKLRIREGKSGAQVGEMNIYLAGGDMWTGALVPDEAAGVRLISADKSCTNPAVPPEGFVFPPVAIGDGQGSGPDRSKEGYVEVFDMGTLQGSATTNSEVPNCTRLLAAPLSAADIVAPLGRLAGSGTLINVRDARAFSYAATALAGLASAPYFSEPSNGVAFPRPEGTTFESSAIDPVSLVTVGGTAYRSTWARGIDAVSAVFMAKYLDGEFVLDAATASRTDWIFTAPTRNAYLRPGAATSGPFKGPSSGDSCDGVHIGNASRDTWGVPLSIESLPPPASPFICWSTSVYSMGGDFTELPKATDVLGSVNTGYRVLAHYENGWMRFRLAEARQMTPLSTIAFPAAADGAAPNISFSGLPLLGFSLSTYDNGSIDCAGAKCKGNYGTLVPLRAWQVIGIQ